MFGRNKHNEILTAPDEEDKVSAFGILLQQKEVKLKGFDGVERTFILSKIPAIESREIVAQWTANALPKIGDYAVNEAMMLKILSYVGVKIGKNIIRLSTKQLINNHVPDLLLLECIEKSMAEYNWGFFLGEEFSNLKERFLRIFSIWLTQIMTDSFRQSSQPNKQP